MMPLIVARLVCSGAPARLAVAGGATSAAKINRMIFITIFSLTS
jgi:hypothetical protein